MWNLIAVDFSPGEKSTQRMAAITRAHDERGLESPTRSKGVRNVMP